MRRETLTFGNVPVPYAVSWTAEVGTHYLDVCPYSKKTRDMRPGCARRGQAPLRKAAQPAPVHHASIGA